MKNELKIKKADCRGWPGAKNDSIYYLVTEANPDYVDAIVFIKDGDNMRQLKKLMAPLFGTEAQAVYMSAISLFKKATCDFCGRKEEAVLCGITVGLTYCSLCAIGIQASYEPLNLKRYICDSR